MFHKYWSLLLFYILLTPVLWPPHAKSWLIGKDSDAGTDWEQEKKGKTEDEMAGWHHWLDGRESQWTPGVGDGQEGLACCDSWGRKESDTTDNWSDQSNRKLIFSLSPYSHFSILNLTFFLFYKSLCSSLSTLFLFLCFSLSLLGNFPTL